MTRIFTKGIDVDSVQGKTSDPMHHLQLHEVDVRCSVGSTISKLVRIRTRCLFPAICAATCLHSAISLMHMPMTANSAITVVAAAFSKASVCRQIRCSDSCAVSSQSAFSRGGKCSIKTCGRVVRCGWPIISVTYYDSHWVSSYWATGHF